MKSQDIRDNVNRHTKELCNWYLEHGYCNNMQMWSFKVFHKNYEDLFRICSELIKSEYTFMALKWNRSADYDIDGWVAIIYKVESFNYTELYEFKVKLDMWLLENGQCEFGTYNPEFYTQNDGQIPSVFSGTAAEIIEFEPRKPPKNEKQKKNWSDVWRDNLEKELEKINAPTPKIQTPELDSAYKQVCVGNNDFKDQPIHFLNFSLKSNSIFITDMRPGPSDDGVRVRLEPGEYDVSVYLSGNNDVYPIKGIRAILIGYDFDERKYIEDISVDGGSIGIYDYQRLRACFGYNSEEMYGWGESGVVRSDAPYGVLIYDLKRGYILPYIQSGDGDGVYPVYELYNKGNKVGFEVNFDV